MRVLKGTASNLTSPKLYRVGRSHWYSRDRYRTALVTENLTKSISGIGAVITSADFTQQPSRLPVIANVSQESLSQLSSGDVVLLNPDGEIVQLWDADSEHNALLVTNVCNCRCLMCPQPSAPDPPEQLRFNLELLRLTKGSRVKSVGFTGGEPTLRVADLCTLLSYCRRALPHTTIGLLTNGRAYANWDTARRVATAGHPNTLHCISLLADIASIHDELVGVAGSFQETISGLHNLARLQQPVEIRVVLTALNCDRLPHIAEYAYRNFPFVQHIAFMGMETTGLAAENLDRLWIEPLDYRRPLADAVRILHRRDMSVSVYNVPRCLLPPHLWSFARDSISSWKKDYLHVCQDCSERDACCGVFSTSKLTYAGIHPPSFLVGPE